MAQARAGEPARFYYPDGATGPTRTASPAFAPADLRKGESVYFELHKLFSERLRLERMRALLRERISTIDKRLDDIAKSMDRIDPSKRA
jgi:hypothetical protein